MTQGLTQEVVRGLFDYVDGQLLRKHDVSKRWKAGGRVGSVNALGYRQLRVQGKQCLEHQVIFLWCHGYLPEVIDHVNRRPDDNRIENLRPATKCQNAINAKVRRDNTSGAKGVYWSTKFSKWHARVWKDGRLITVGYFHDLEAAVSARESANKAAHGEFAAACAEVS